MKPSRGRFALAQAAKTSPGRDLWRELAPCYLGLATTRSAKMPFRLVGKTAVRPAPKP